MPELQVRSFSDNKQNILNGDFTNKNIQVGANANELIGISITDVKTTVSAAIAAGTKVNTFTDAQTAITNIQKSITALSTQRSTLGTIQNRLEHTTANLDNISENTQAADTDMAEGYRYG